MKCECEICKRHRFFKKISEKYNMDEEDLKSLDMVALYALEKETEYQMTIGQLLDCMKGSLSVLHGMSIDFNPIDWPSGLSRQIERIRLLIAMKKGKQ